MTELQGFPPIPLCNPDVIILQDLLIRGPETTFIQGT